MAFEYGEVLNNRKSMHSPLVYQYPERFLEERIDAQQPEQRVA